MDDIFTPQSARRAIGPPSGSAYTVIHPEYAVSVLCRTWCCSPMSSPTGRPDDDDGQHDRLQRKEGAVTSCSATGFSREHRAETATVSVLRDVLHWC
jgi:hypothetical protein